MIQGIDINQRIEFISSFDNTEPKTIFVFRPLGGTELMKHTDMGETKDFVGYLCSCIVEIKNCAQDKTEFIKSLPLNVIAELLVKAGSLNNVSDEDKKK